MKRLWQERTSRRRLLGTSLALGSSATAVALAACRETNGRSSPGSSDGAQSAAKAGVNPYSSATPSALNPRRGGTITMAFTGGTTALWDPYRASTNVVQHYAAIFDTLLQNDPKSLTYRPGLLQSWRRSSPGTTTYSSCGRESTGRTSRPPTACV